MLYKVFWYVNPVSLHGMCSDVEDVELAEEEFDPDRYNLEKDHAEAIALSRLEQRYPGRNISTVVLSFPGWD